MLGIPHGLSTHSSCLPSAAALIGFTGLSSAVLVPISVKLINSFHSFTFNPFGFLFIFLSIHTHTAYICCFAAPVIYTSTFLQHPCPTRTCWLSFSLMFSSSSPLHLHCAVYQRAFHISLGWLINLSKQQHLMAVNVKYAKPAAVHFTTKR